jgi:MFS family permease
MPSSLSSSPASLTQTLTYFLVVCLLSIAFLVFLNASASFVITDVIGIEPRQRSGNNHVGGGTGRGGGGDHGTGAAGGSNKGDVSRLRHAGRRTGNVGDMVGTLGFADELVALVACPLWGMLSDRVGARAVCVAGYMAVAVALVCSVHAADVYPQLLLARVLFSVGGAATYVLPSSYNALSSSVRVFSLSIWFLLGRDRSVHCSSIGCRCMGSSVGFSMPFLPF